MKYRIGKKQKRAVLDENGLEILIFPIGKEKEALEYCNFLNSKNEERILCAAIWYKDLELIRPDVLQPYNFRPNNIEEGIVLCGWGHHNCLYQMVAIVGERAAGATYEEGFLTSKNRFLTREEAAIVAYNAGQIKEELPRLFSEDLY